jgi:molybdopterin-guanine dinucleotide biosynthesis protein A
MSVDNTIVILTGGTSKRMGQDKATLPFGNSTLLAFQYEQIPTNSPVVIVGPRSFQPAIYVRENPLGGGPVAGLAAAMTQITSDFFTLVAVDSPFGLTWLTQQKLGPAVQALIPRDSQGQPHYLCALYRTSGIRGAITELGSVTNASMRNLLSHVDGIQYVDEPSTDALSSAEVLLDVNTSGALEVAHQVRKRVWGQ